MTLGEVEEFEELTGIDITRMPERPPAKALSALIFLQERRKNPQYTIEDARALKISELEVEEPDPPTLAADAS
jgi:hypothetical protein